MEEKVAAGLVYGGYLKPEDMPDPNEVAIAMNLLIADTVPASLMDDEQTKIFPDMANWRPSEYALDFLNRNIRGFRTPDPANPGIDRLEADLESGDPARIALAQSYLALKGADVGASGVIDRATFDAATAAITAPLEMPEGLIQPNGEAAIDVIYTLSARGLLYLPTDTLTDDEKQIAASLPAAADAEPGERTRETFLAMRLIADDPKSYQALLDAENARRAQAKVDVEITQP